MSCHLDCKYNCGATDCIAPERPCMWVLKPKAIEQIKKQPYFTVKGLGGLLKNIEELDPEFSETIDKNYWDLI